jgi:hypothetical protein
MVVLGNYAVQRIKQLSGKKESRKALLGNCQSNGQRLPEFFQCLQGLHRTCAQDEKSCSVESGSHGNYEDQGKMQVGM